MGNPVMSSVRVNRGLVIVAVSLVLVIAAMALVGCGGTVASADKTLFDKVLAAWIANDVPALDGLYTPDAVIYWPQGVEPAKSVGIEEIRGMVSGYPLDPTPVENGVSTYTPTAKDIGNTSVKYSNAKFVSGPVYAQRDLYMVTLEVRDGKVANMWVTPMYGG